MLFKDILLVLITYPEANNPSQIHDAISFSAAVGARISALACIVKVRAPHHDLADAFIDIPALVEGEKEKSSDTASALLAVFEAAAKKAGIFQESLRRTCFTSEAPDLLVREARLRDLAIIPAVPESDYYRWDDYRWYAESILFGSGRPLLALPLRPPGELALRRVVIAWDGSRAAARAVADAVSILEHAKEIRVLTVVNERELSGESPAMELSSYLARRGLAAEVDLVDAAGRQIGEALNAYIASNEPDLLVMGAYGHSRVREFILGGATLSMLSKPTLPILLSH
jgi:nucleotide-binding universal stress UspA family protein